MHDSEARPVPRMLWWQWAALAVLVAAAAYLGNLLSPLPDFVEPSLARRATYVSVAVAATLATWIAFRRMRPSTHRILRLWVGPPVALVGSITGLWLAFAPGAGRHRWLYLMQTACLVCTAVLLVREQRRADRQRAASADGA